MLIVFSIARGVFPAALLMLLAAVVFTFGGGSWWNLTLPLWMLAGITTVPFMLLIFLRADFPINVFGSWLFAGTLLTLAACYVARYSWIRYGRNLWWVPIFATVFLLLGLVVAERAVGTWQYVKQGHW